MALQIAFSTPGLTADTLIKHIDEIMTTLRSHLKPGEHGVFISMSATIESMGYSKGDVVKLTALLQQLGLIKRLSQKKTQMGPYRWYVCRMRKIQEHVPEELLEAAWRDCEKHTDTVKTLRDARTRIGELEQQLADTSGIDEEFLAGIDSRHRQIVDERDTAIQRADDLTVKVAELEAQLAQQPAARDLTQAFLERLDKRAGSSS